MIWLVVGLILFFVPHSVGIFALQWRNHMAQRMGLSVWKILFALISAAGLALMIYGYSEYRVQAPLWYTPLSAMRHLAFLLMPVALIAMLASVFRGWLQRTLKHPLLVAVKIWALVHLLNNGDAASVILFASFLLWAVLMRISLKRRGGGRPVPSIDLSFAGDWLAVVGGVAASYWLAYGNGHGLLFGVPII
ncbi:MAG: NnrU family protein [Wenzhouxiangellaceae bacterium]